MKTDPQEISIVKPVKSHLHSKVPSPLPPSPPEYSLPLLNFQMLFENSDATEETFPSEDAPAHTLCEFSNMTIRTRFHPYYVTTYIRVMSQHSHKSLPSTNNVFELCFALPLKLLWARQLVRRSEHSCTSCGGHNLTVSSSHHWIDSSTTIPAPIEPSMEPLEHQVSCADRAMNGAPKHPDFLG